MTTQTAAIASAVDHAGLLADSQVWGDDGEIPTPKAKATKAAAKARALADMEEERLTKPKAKAASRKTAKTKKAKAAKAPKQTKPKPKAKAPRPAVTVLKATGRHCLCGCGMAVPRTFRPGHDARLKGFLQRSLRNDPRTGDPSIDELVAVFVAEWGDGASVVERDLAEWIADGRPIGDPEAPIGHPAHTLAVTLNPAWAKFLQS